MSELYEGKESKRRMGCPEKQLQMLSTELIPHLPSVIKFYERRTP